MKDLSRRQLISKTLVASAAASTSVSALSAQSQPAQRTRETSPTFDVVIVGGGSAGAVMAARLSENPARRVLLLEAGHSYAPYDYPRLIADSDVLGANGNPEFEWGYRTEPGYVSHAIGAIRGKVLGGSSGVNGAVAIRARPEDFNRWDLPGWGYQDLLPAFKNWRLVMACTTAQSMAIAALFPSCNSHWMTSRQCNALSSPPRAPTAMTRLTILMALQPMASAPTR